MSPCKIRFSLTTRETRRLSSEFFTFIKNVKVTPQYDLWKNIMKNPKRQMLRKAEQKQESWSRICQAIKPEGTDVEFWINTPILRY